MIYSFTNAPGLKMLYNYATHANGSMRADWFQTADRSIPGIVTGSFVARQQTQDLYVSYEGDGYAVAGVDNRLYYYIFPDRQTVDTAKTSVMDLTAIRRDKNDEKVSLIVNTPDMFLYRNSSWSGFAGSFTSLMRGNFTFGDGTDEYVGIIAQKMHVFWPEDPSYYKQIMNNQHHVAVPADLYYYTDDDPGKGDEIFVQKYNG
jgi:hypothetical protein